MGIRRMPDGLYRGFFHQLHQPESGLLRGRVLPIFPAAYIFGYCRLRLWDSCQQRSHAGESYSWQSGLDRNSGYHYLPLFIFLNAKGYQSFCQGYNLSATGISFLRSILILLVRSYPLSDHFIIVFEKALCYSKPGRSLC